MTSVDFKWLFTSAKIKRIIVLHKDDQTTMPVLNFLKVFFVKMFMAFTVSDLCWPQMKADLSEKQYGSWASSGWPPCQLRTSLKLAFSVYCLQGFQQITSVHLKWPLTYTKTKRFLCSPGWPLCQLRTPWIKHFQGMIFTPGFQQMTSDDLWPLKKQ